MEYGDINLSTSEINQRLEAVPNKQDTLESGVNIKTINGQSILGSGDLSVGGSESGKVNLYVRNSSSSLTNKKFRLTEVYKASLGHEPEMYENTTASITGVGDYVKPNTKYVLTTEYVYNYYVMNNGISIYTTPDQSIVANYEYTQIDWNVAYVTKDRTITIYHGPDVIGVIVYGTTSSAQSREVIKSIIIPCGITSIEAMRYSNVYNVPQDFVFYKMKDNTDTGFILNDYNGLTNTKQLASVNVDSPYNKVQYYRGMIDTDFADRDVRTSYDLYIPSAGEMYIIYQFKDIINSYLRNINSTEIYPADESIAYGTSTVDSVGNYLNRITANSESGSVKFYRTTGGTSYIYPLMYLGDIKRT